MKKVYNGANNQSVQMQNLQNKIKKEIKKLEEIGHLGENADAFLEKYADVFFDNYREDENDFEITNDELQKSFQIAYAYLQFLRTCVGIEEDYANDVF